MGQGQVREKRADAYKATASDSRNHIFKQEITTQKKPAEDILA
jgi:hypothetical protein